MLKDDDATTLEPAMKAPKPSLGPDELAPGTKAGRYLIYRALAAGGCGTVYSAEDPRLGGRVAVKVLHRRLAGSAEMVERFLREARVVNQIRHPNIVEIHDFGTLDDGRPYFAMELLSGTSLTALVEQRGRLSPREALAYLAPVCAALAAAHGAGVVHRDLKASNILVVREGEPPEVKLVDFGIAKLLRPEPGEQCLTAVGQRLGSSLAMPPEQIRGGAIGPAADIYSLGVLLFRMVTGQYPFRSNDAFEIERLHMYAPPPRPSELAPVPPALDAVVLRCLEKTPELRFASVEAFVEALRSAVADDLGARPTTRAALAIHVAVWMSEGSDQDDGLLEELATLLDATEMELGVAGFALCQLTGTALLGVRLLADDPEEARAQRSAAVELGKTLQALTLRAQQDGRLRVAIHLHEGPAEVRSTATGEVVSGGALLRTDEWPTASSRELHVGPQVLVGLGAGAGAC